MRVWIKYASVSFKAAETCQDCHLFSDSIAVKWQFKSGGLSLSWQVFNLCSISAHCRELFFIHCFSSPSFISVALLFSRSLFLFFFILTQRLVLLFFLSFCRHHLVLQKHPWAGGAQTANSGSLITRLSREKPHLLCLLLVYPAILSVSAPTPTPTGLKIFPLFLTSVLLVINWDEHVGWRPLEGGSDPPGNVCVREYYYGSVWLCVYVCNPAKMIQDMVSQSILPWSANHINSSLKGKTHLWLLKKTEQLIKNSNVTF